MMKLSKWEGAIVSVAALFLAFTAGWFLRGGAQSGPIRVETQRAPEPAEAAIFLPPAPGSAEPSETPEVLPAEDKLNINTATAEELQVLPGIGEKRAQAILADREANGPFRFPEDVTRVKGIGEEILAGIIDLITTEETP